MFLDVGERGENEDMEVEVLVEEGYGGSAASASRAAKRVLLFGYGDGNGPIERLRQRAALALHYPKQKIPGQ